MLDREDSQTPEAEKRNHQLFRALKENANNLSWKDKWKGKYPTVSFRRNHLRIQGEVRQVKLYKTTFGGNTVFAEQILGQADACQVVILSNDGSIHVAYSTEGFTQTIGLIPNNSLVENGRITPSEIKEIFEAAEAASLKH